MKRAAFRCQITAIAPEKLVFLDECSLGLNLFRLYGWVIGGGRCKEEVPLTRGTHLSLLGAFSLASPQCPNGLRVLWHKFVAQEGRLEQSEL